MPLIIAPNDLSAATIASMNTNGAAALTCGCCSAFLMTSRYSEKSMPYFMMVTCALTPRTFCLKAC